MTKKSKVKNPVKKCIVEPVGPFTLLNTTGETIHHHRPSVTTMTSFIEERLYDGVLKVKARNLPFEASDDAFKECLKACEGKKNMAIMAFCSEFGLNPQGESLEDLEVDIIDEAPDAKSIHDAMEDTDVINNNTMGTSDNDSDDTLLDSVDDSVLSDNDLSDTDGVEPQDTKPRGRRGRRSSK